MNHYNNLMKKHLLRAKEMNAHFQEVRHERLSAEEREVIGIVLGISLSLAALAVATSKP